MDIRQRTRRLIGLEAGSGAVPEALAGFDARLYARRHGDLAGLDEAALARHYRLHGRAEGRAGEPAALLLQLEARHGAFEPEFHVALYRAANPDLAQVLTDDWEYAAHYLEHGRDEGREPGFATGTGRERHARNAARLESLHARRPEDRDLTLRLARAQVLAGRSGEAGRLLAGVEDEEAAQILAFGAFLGETPIERALPLVGAARARPGFLATAAVAERILAAKAARRPFALVRFGDGEGGFVRVSESDEAAHRALYASNRAYWRRWWFGADFPAADRFEALARELTESVSEADVLGIPYAGWIEHEYAFGNPPGVIGLVNIVRWLDRHGDRLGRTALASQTIHLDLAAADFFPRLLEGERAIGLISCFPELPGRLAARFGVEVEFHKLPGEQHFRAKIGDAAAEGEHFPAVYDAVTARLSRPLDGRIVLIAGGILGKFYARTVRRHGGIALDIGSLADVWAGKATRVGYQTLPGFDLR